MNSTRTAGTPQLIPSNLSWKLVTIKGKCLPKAPITAFIVIRAALWYLAKGMSGLVLKPCDRTWAQILIPIWLSTQLAFDSIMGWQESVIISCIS